MSFFEKANQILDFFIKSITILVIAYIFSNISIIKQYVYGQKLEIASKIPIVIYDKNTYEYTRFYIDQTLNKNNSISKIIFHFSVNGSQSKEIVKINDSYNISHKELFEVLNNLNLVNEDNSYKKGTYKIACNIEIYYSYGKIGQDLNSYTLEIKLNGKNKHKIISFIRNI